MAGSKSNTLENAILDTVLGGPQRTIDATVWAALYTVAPTDAGGGTEVTGGSYARVSITNNATNWPAASGGSKSNGTAISFPQASGSWGTVVAFALHNHATADQPLIWGDLTASKTVTSGDTAQFAIGGIVYTED